MNDIEVAYEMSTNAFLHKTILVTKQPFLKK